MRKIYSIVTIGVLVLVVGFMLFGCRSKEVESALIYINQQNDWDKAMEQLNIAVQVNPADVEAHLLLAEGYGHFSKYEKMVDELKTTESLMSGTPNPKFQNKIENLRNKYWTQTFNNGIKYVKNIDKDSLAIGKAKEEFQNSILINPKDSRAHKNLAFVNVKANDLDAAISNYEAVLKLDEKDVDALSSLANLFINTKQYEKCVEVTDRILTIDSTNVEAISQKAMAYDLLAEFVLQEFRDLDEKEFTDDQKEEYNKAQEKSKEYKEKAFLAYEVALQNDPDNVDLLFNLGRLYYQGKNYEKAIEKFKVVLEKKPDDYEANVNIGNAYLLLAEKIMQKYRDMDEKQLAKIPKADFDADQDLSKEHYKSGLPYLEKAVVISLDKKGAWYNLAVAYVQSGEAKKGEKCFAIADEVEAGNYLQATNFIDENLSDLK